MISGAAEFGGQRNLEGSGNDYGGSRIRGAAGMIREAAGIISGAAETVGVMVSVNILQEGTEWMRAVDQGVASSIARGELGLLRKVRVTRVIVVVNIYCVLDFRVVVRVIFVIYIVYWN